MHSYSGGAGDVILDKAASPIFQGQRLFHSPVLGVVVENIGH